MYINVITSPENLLLYSSIQPRYEVKTCSEVDASTFPFLRKRFS